MSDTQIIAATIQVDTGSSNSNVAGLNKSLGDVKSNLKDTGATAASTGKQIEGSSASFGNLKNQMAALPGPLGAAGEGVNKLSQTFKALLANPVVLVIAAIVAGLALLYKAFTNTFEGGEKMEQVFAGIKAAAQALIDNLGSIARAAVDLFSFDFSGAVDEIKGVVKAAGDAYSAMAKLTEQAQKLARQQSALDYETAAREKDLAILREKAYDDSVPVAERLESLKKLRQASEDAAHDEIYQALKVKNNAIDMLTLEADGYRKNQKEILSAMTDYENKVAAIKAGVRSVDKQLRVAEKQDEADKKEAKKAGEDAANKAREQNQAYRTELIKLQQANALALITDQYAKEKQLLENKIQDDQSTIKKDFENKKLTRDQYNKLVAAELISAGLERDALTDKHNKDIAIKNEAFQKDLNSTLNKIKLDGITDAREAEKVQLQITYEQELQQAISTYKEDAVAFQAKKQALDTQLKADQAKLDAKNKKEDDKKKLDLAVAKAKEITNDNKASIKAKQLAVDAEQAAIQKAFDDKTISEVEYNNKLKELSDERKQIDQLELQSKVATYDIISQGLNSLADLIGKQTAVGKAAAVASTIITTYEAAWKAFRNAQDNPASIPFPAYPYIQAGIAIVAGLQTVKSILAVQAPGGSASTGGVGGAPSITAPAAPLAPRQTSTNINQASLNQIGNATSSRAYVLDSDVNSNRERDIRLNRAARLGG